MKVLFLSNTAGQGHHSTANALYETLTALGAECEKLDTYKYINALLYQGLARGYLLSTSLVPATYGRFYRLAETRKKNDTKLTPITQILSAKLLHYFKNEFNPDVIVCTHVFSAQIIDLMKKKGQLDAKVFGVVTDYTIHPYWQDLSHIDYFVTASELLTNSALKKGIAKDSILPFGIPIQHKFSTKMPKAEARRLLGIDENKFTILLMSGSMGHGNITEVLKSIDPLENEFQVLAVCGNNKHAQHKISGLKTRKTVYTYGFVNNVEVMMDASDCIITKPGGLTTSEALAKQLPIIMVNPIPGQEERNVDFMLNNGIAVNVTKTYPIDDALYQLFLYPEKLQNMVENIGLIGKPNATKNLCDFIMSLEKDEN